MKKLVCFLMAASLVFALSACGEKAPEESQTEITAETPVVSPSESPSETESQPQTELNPIFADKVKDGTYEITVDSSSSMFNVIHCQLIVENGGMKAVMTMSGDGYGKVYMGTGEQALADTEENYIPFELDAEGKKTFTVPVEALDKEVQCAAWSLKKEKWYDRTLIFLSEGMAEDAFTEE